MGHPMEPICTYRTGEEQDALYAKGRTAPGNRVTNAKAGSSPHNWRMACDLVFSDGVFKGPWEDFGREAEAVGLTWGGRFRLKDFDHVERKDWRTHVNEIRKEHP